MTLESQNAVCAVMGENFVMISADTCQFSEVIMVENSLNKLCEICDNIIITSVGDFADVSQFEDYVVRRHALHRFQTKLLLSTAETANLAANHLAKLLLNYEVSVSSLIAGFDDGEGPSLFVVDAYGSCERITKTATLGLAGMFAATVVDKDWRPAITQDEAYEIIKNTANQIQLRTSINLPQFAVAVVDSCGRRDLPPVTVSRTGLLF